MKNAEQHCCIARLRFNEVIHQDNLEMLLYYSSTAAVED